MSLTGLIPLPYRLLAVLGLAAAAGGACYVAGLHHANAVHDAQDAKRIAQDGQYLLAATQSARAKEQALRAQLDTATDQRTKDAAHHETELAAVRADARRGAVSLRCPSAALPADAQANDPAAASRSGAQDGRDRLVPGAADDLLGIAGGIVEIVRQRNALIDAYNAARQTCNGG